MRFYNHGSIRAKGALWPAEAAPSSFEVHTISERSETWSLPHTPFCGRPGSISLVVCGLRNPTTCEDREGGSKMKM